MIWSKYLLDSEFEELKTIIRKTVQDELARYNSYYEKMIKEESKAKYVDIKALCKELSVTRQTVLNWEKGKVNRLNISSFVRKVGGRKEYNLAAIKQEFDQQYRF